jgi:hypothetical protein
MKYLSLLFIVFLMWWSWGAIQSPTLLPEDTHIGIQEDLRRVISEYIQENMPTAQDLKFEKFWTETVKESQVKATFAYSFTDMSSETEEGTARVGVEGHAILNRSREENSEYDIWSLDELYVLNNKVTFQEGVTIRATPENKQ